MMPSPAIVTPWRDNAQVSYALAALIGVVVFVIDAFTPLDIAIAVLYVAVVLLVASAGSRPATAVAACVCVALTLLAFALSHDMAYQGGAAARCAVSLLAIVTTAMLSLRNLASTAILRERLRLLDLTHDAIVVHDMNDRITFWNQGAEELYGWSAKQAIGQSIHELTQTNASISLDDIRREVLRVGQWQGELQRVRKDGETVMISSRWALWRDRSGRPLAILATNNDITDRKHMEAELRRSTAELAHATRVTMLGEMAASIAHEVTQPLAALVTAGDAALRWLHRPAPDLSEAEMSIQQMIRDAQRAAAVIRRIRQLACKRAQDETVLDLNAVVRESLELLRGELDSQRVEVKTEYAEPPPLVRGDRVQLQQVIINLLLNGIQAMADVTARPRCLRLCTRSTRDRLAQVVVEDTGVGISAENSSRLFNAFFTTKKDGMGMGLSICRSIVEAHGGRIWAESQEHRGTVMQFVLPLNEETCDAH